MEEFKCCVTICYYSEHIIIKTELKELFTISGLFIFRYTRVRK